MTSEIKKYYSKIMAILDNTVFVTDVVSKITITIGVVMIVGGLYLMIANPSGLSQTTQSVASTLDWIPGIPFYIGDLISNGAVIMGLVIWILGIDLLVLGLGLWVRHRFARLTAIMILLIAAFVQFVQFLYVGIIGSPASIIELLFDAVLLFFLLLRFDSKPTIQIIEKETLTKPQ